MLNLLLIACTTAAVGFFLGWVLNNRFGVRSLDAAQKRADEATRAARREAKKIKQRAELEAKEETLQTRKKADRDLRSRKGQMAKRERDLKQAAQALEDRELDLARHQEELEVGHKELETEREKVHLAQSEAAEMLEEQNRRLEAVSGMGSDEARRQLMANLRADARLEAAAMIKEIKDEAQRTADTEAVKIIALAVERAASEFSSERTISFFDLPEGSDLKGRIIGQEGKNIRAFEQSTGIQLIIDEETNRVTLSGYNPVKREVAKRVLEVLVKDGNIHPRRIEELTKRYARRLDEEMKKAGHETLKELSLNPKGTDPEIVQLLGRLKYRTSYGQNVLLHSKEVAYLTGMMAAELRLDESLARRAGLLHDIGKAIDYEREGTHPEIGAEVATKVGEHETVINAIASHHEDCEATSPISVLVAAADALSGARPGARRKTVTEYIQRIERLEELASEMPGVDHSYAIQAGREIRVIAKSREVDDARVDLLATDLADRIQAEMDYPGKIKITVIRELRASATAH